MPGFLLHLYGPMQSWADTGFGQLREAGEFPSRAAVIGIVAAARGIPRTDDRLLELDAALRVHVATVRPGRVLRDFHTVETREGKPRTLTSRDYHHDAHFVVLVEGDDAALLAECEAALRQPIYGTFLGRRSCPPAVPLLPERVEGDPFEALREATYATAEAFPRGDRTRRRGRAADVLAAWLDGHLHRDQLPMVFADADVSYGTRRARLVGPRRAYASAPFTRLRLRSAASAPSPDDHQTYFDAAS
jgi:CRISPR system Cascade subunit CasD